MRASEPVSDSHGFAAYRRVLAIPGIAPMLVASTLARLPIGIGAVAFVLFVQGETGSFAAAGAVAGGFTIGAGITGPLLARLIDRRGSRGVLLPASIVSSLAFLGVVWLGHQGAGTAPLVAAAFLCGASIPPLGGVMRQLWPRMVGPEELPTLYAVDSVVIEILFVAGPLLAGALTAVASASAALVAAAILGISGTVWFVAVARVEPRSHEERSAGGIAGALASPAVRLLTFSGLPVGAVFGSLDVALPAFGEAHGAAALGGPFTAALALGSGIGGLVYGARPHVLGPPAQAFIRISAIQVLTCLPLLLVASITEMFVAAALAGVCVAPLVNLRNQLTQAGLVAGTATEAFTWITLAVTLGASSGSAIAGPLVEHWGWRAGAIAACAFPAVAALLVLLGRDVLPSGQAQTLRT
jgi:MFS family permease